MRRIALFIFFTGLLGNINAQEEDERMIQFTGRVLNEFLQPLKFAHILDLRNNQGAITDREGKFSFIVFPNDSILFSTLGYKKSFVIVPDDLENPFFIRDVLMASDTILITEIEIYPWNDYEEFKEAFLNLELPEDDLDRARKNIALIKTQILLENNMTSRENFNEVMKQQFNQTTINGTQPTYQIFNIFAWQKFFKAIKNGDFKQK
jgi:hypothetical protein